jgi:hypothetical protein
MLSGRELFSPVPEYLSRPLKRSGRLPRLQLSFHTTFALKKSELSRLLKVVAEVGLKGPIEELMARTGFGNKKVGPVKSWASRGGLIRNGVLTPEGELVWKYDPRLLSQTTAWFMHFNLSFGDQGLTTPPAAVADWGGWPYFVFAFRPQHPDFTEDDLAAEGAAVFDDKPSLIKSNFAYMLRAYTSPEALGACRFLTWNAGRNTYEAGEPDLPNPFLIGHVLARLWERDFSGTTSVVTDDLSNHHMGIAAVLGLHPSSMQRILDRLEGRSVVEQRRTVAPYQLVRRWESPFALLEKAYRDDQSA